MENLVVARKEVAEAFRRSRLFSIVDQLGMIEAIDDGSEIIKTTLASTIQSRRAIDHLHICEKQGFKLVDLNEEP